MTPLAQSIYKTLAFFDAQDMPLTLMEMVGYLPPGGEPVNLGSLTSLQETIEQELAGFIEHKEGFYFLRGRGDSVGLRKKKYRVSLGNFRKAKKYLFWLRFFPYLRAVAISGSLALLNSSEKSDIDLFVLTKKNRIWLTRFMVSLYFQILGVRRYAHHICGRFCLNHYGQENLLINEDRNLYTAVEYASLMPVLGKKVFERFWMQNQWIKEYLPLARQELPLPLFVKEGSKREVLSRIFEFLFEFTLIGPLLNYLSGLYQKRRIKTQEYILVSDSELSFHPGSRGQKVLAEFATSFDKST